MAEHNHANFIWSIAESLRGPFRKAEYGGVVLPFTILRRLDSVLAPTKQAVLAAYEKEKDGKVSLELLLPHVAKQPFFNVSRFDMRALTDEPEQLRENIGAYLAGFSKDIRDIFEKFEFDKVLNKLEEKNKLFAVVEKFAAADLHPDRVSNIQMGLIFEELIRRFNEQTDEEAGDHYTPREVIQLMVDLLFHPDDELTIPGKIRSIYDPTAGTGGMLSVADEYLRKQNDRIDLSLYGQDYNDQSYAVCKADMLLKGQPITNIRLGDTLTQDQFPDRRFDYALSNPPFGVDWKDQQRYVIDEHEKLGFNGRFGAGLPRVNDGAMLFLLHLISKMNPADKGGARIGIVLNGSPLFTGGAGSGESNIRKWILDNDLLEAIVALPHDMFYNTGIATYIWILTNRKSEDRAGTVQLIDATKMFRKLRKGVGSKRNELGPDDITRIVSLYEEYTDADGEVSKVFRNEDFLYRTITVERPLRLAFHVTPERIDTAFETKAVLKLDEDTQTVLRGTLEGLLGGDIVKSRDAFIRVLDDALRRAGLRLAIPAKKAVLEALSERDGTADVCLDRKGNPEPDTEQRDTENVPWDEDINDYFEREVKPYVPEAWIDHTRTKEGAEIPFTRHFYKYVPPRDLDDIDRDLEAVMGRLRVILAEVEA